MFDYIIDKIGAADFAVEPFRHLYIERVFREEHFAAIVSSPEVDIAPQESDGALFEALIGSGYKIIEFPGCITSRSKYLAWRAGRRRGGARHSACEGFGVTLRLIEPESRILRELKAFLGSGRFNRALAAKFEVPFEETFADNGIQKYLDGYEISPHPDIRRKAATFMVNINPHRDSESRSHHTQYLRFKPQYRYVQAFWEGNPDYERCWVPWSWCETEWMQSANNSLVAFSPADDTLHAVKAAYDHLPGQRTQLYGNFWHKAKPALAGLEWEALDLRKTPAAGAAGVRRRAGLSDWLRRIARRSGRLLRGRDGDAGLTYKRFEP